MILDILIIGAGPIGLACGIAAAERSLSYLIIDKGTLTNSLYHYPLHMTFFSTAERLEIGNIPFSCIPPKPGRQEALEYYRNVARAYKLNTSLYEEALDVAKTAEGLFRVETGRTVRVARHVIIATGFYDIPKLLEVPGEELPKVSHYYREAHPYTLQKLLVVGASNSSVDAALETWRRGADVTMVVRGPAIGERVKYWVKPDIENRIAEGSIRAFFNTSVQEIREQEVLLRTPEGIITIANDFVLALTGYRPDFGWLRRCGVVLEGTACRPVHNPATMESNVAGLYLAGVVCGGLETHKWFIENSRIHAGMILNAIAAKK